MGPQAVSKRAVVALTVLALGVLAGWVLFWTM